MSENMIQYVAAASNGDTDAMAKLYSRTLKASYFLALTLSNDKDEALEITKKAYAKAFCTINKLKKPEAFEIWMKQNVALVYKEGVKFVFGDADAGAVENSSEFLSEDAYNNEEISAVILEAVSGLSPELRAAVVLHYNNGMPVNVLAKFFGVSESTANALLGKARGSILKAAELDSSSAENGALPVLTKIFQRAATAAVIENSDVRDIFIYAIDAYQAAKPVEPVETVTEESVQEETPAVSEQPAVVPSAISEDSNVISLKRKINEILDGENIPSEESVEEQVAENDDEVEVPAFASEEKTQEAIEHFSDYDNQEDTVVNEIAPKKKIDLKNIKLNKKLLGIVCAALAVIIVVAVAISKFSGGNNPDNPSVDSDKTNVVDTLSATYDWRIGGFEECTEISYLDENCLSFKSVVTGKYGLLDYQGNVILQPNYNGFRQCRTGRDYTGNGYYHSLVIMDAGEYKFSVVNGNVVIEEEPHMDHILHTDALGQKSYEERDRYFEGYAAARKDGKWGYVSQEKDKKVIPYEYEAVNEYASALDYAGSDYCRPVTDGHIAVKKNGMMGIINLDNDIVVPFEYTNIMPGKNGVFVACKGGTWGVILIGDAITSFGGININVDPVSPDNNPGDSTDSSTDYDTYKVISDNGANIREDAGADYDKIGSLEYGDTVRAYDSKRADNGNKWIKVRHEGKYGWVAMSNLEIVSE